MENKYYTPTIEEFHVGFEFEHLNFEGKLVSFIEQKREWNKEICDWAWLDIICDDYEHDKEEVLKYRVKYLDKEDIESLGVVIDLEDNVGFEGYFKSDSVIFISYRIDSKHLNILNDGSSLFYGTIKNKSELKVLLKQLGICR